MKLYEKIEAGESLSKEFLERTYEKLLKSYYGKDIVYDREVKLEWMRLGHQDRWTFYSYKYATGLLIATTIYSNLVEGKLSKEDYLRFLSSGSKESSMKLSKLLHIDFKNLDILGNGFDIMENDIKIIAELSKKVH